MIAPKTPKPTAREEAAAYTRATTRDNDTCQRCLRSCGPSTRDHRKNRGVGGRTTVSNLQILGGTGTTGCHGWKTEHPALANAEGWGVPSWADPLVYPGRRWLGGSLGTVRLAWVLYRDDGRWEEITDEEAQRRIGN